MAFLTIPALLRRLVLTLVALVALAVSVYAHSSEIPNTTYIQAATGHTHPGGDAGNLSHDSLHHDHHPELPYAISPAAFLALSRQEGRTYEPERRKIAISIDHPPSSASLKH